MTKLEEVAIAIAHAGKLNLLEVDHKELARAALKTIRRPTDAMIEAAFGHDFNSKRYLTPESRAEIAKSFDAMIEAILNEEGTPNA